ncbi:hypothetical protein GIB67_023029 [Kingdonia uniflora]|uniref:AIG1-type G domain-containing protein n=1 Tax=Kingdonia uniflora TaxID=39325 RepID=A0A7J7P2W0_9MAGN|nr:hypothetical protein GIB67_023029 [Kingdonia uniflora]
MATTTIPPTIVAEEEAEVSFTHNSSPGGGGAADSSSSSISVSSFKSEEEDEFEMATERSFVADLEEEIMELETLEGKEFVPVVVEPVLGSSSFLSPEVLVIREPDSVVETREFSVEGKDNDNPIVVENPVAEFSSILKPEIVENPDRVVEAPKAVNLIEDSSVVEKSEDGVLDFEAKGPLLVDKSGLKGIGDKEDILPEHLKLEDIAKPLVQDEGASELKEGVFEENKDEFLDAEKTLIDVDENVDSLEASVGNQEDKLLENLILDEIVKPVIPYLVAVEVKDGVMKNEDKSEVLNGESTTIDVEDIESIEALVTNVLPENLKLGEVNSLVQDEGATELKNELLEEKKVGVLDIENSFVDVEDNGASVEVLEGHTKDILSENPKLGENVNPVVQVEDVTELKGEILVEKKIGVLDVENSFVDVEDNVASVEVLEGRTKDILSEHPKLDENVNPAVQVKDVTELNDMVLEEGKKSEVLDGDDISVEVKENGASDVKEVELPVEKNIFLMNENSQVSPVTDEPTKFKFVVANEYGNLAKEDSFVDIKQPMFVSDISGVGDLEDNNVSETEPLKSVVEPSMSMDIELHQQAAVIEQPHDQIYGDSHVNREPETISIVPESKPDVAEVEEDDEINRVSIDESVSQGQVYSNMKSEPESGAITQSGTEVKESIVKVVSDGVESRSTGKVDCLDEPQVEDESQIIFSKEPIYLEHSDYEEDGSISNEDVERMIFNGSGTAEQIMKELEQGSGISFLSGSESSEDHSQRIDGQIVMETDEEVDTDEEGEGKELFDSAALAALLKAATSARSDGGNVTITSSDGSKLFSVERPAGLGPLKPAPRSNRANLFTPSDAMVGEELENNLSDEEKKKLDKIQLIRVKFLRLVNRLGHSLEDSIAAQVLYRLVLAAGRNTSQVFSLEAAKRTAMELEAEAKDDLDFSLNILVIGKTGVGKSATINSIFGEEKAIIDAFEPATNKVKEITGTVSGVHLRVFDTPGLRSSVMEQPLNRKILASVKKIMKKSPPDILLYIDRLDAQTRDLNDLPLLRTINTTFGSSIWRSAIVTLTHAASAPPDGPSGSPLSYETFVAQRSHVVQQSIGQAVGDLRMMNPSLMNPVSLAENHPSCRTNREGQRILPNGQSWRSQLLFLCYSMKILSEANSLSKPQDPFDHRKLFGFRVRSPPLPYLLSSLLQSRAHPKLQTDQGGENADSDIDLDDLSDTEKEDEDEYDQLPPFKPLRKSQISKLSKEQRKAYFEEYDYRVKLLQKKQWIEELNRMREMKKRGKDGVNDKGYLGDDADIENGAPAAVPVPLPDMALQPSFDGDNPAYRQGSKY